MTTISRRTLAKGAAWSAPAVAIAATAPALAASNPTTVNGKICQIYYGEGSANMQVMEIAFGSETAVPAGTVMTYTITVDNTNWSASWPNGGETATPTLDYSPSEAWTSSVNRTSYANGVTTFEFTVTVNEDMAAGWCGPKVIWTDAIWMRPKSTVTVESQVPTNPDEPVTGTPESVAWQVAKRYPSGVNEDGRELHVDITSCAVPLQWSFEDASGATRCARNDTSASYNGTCYPNSGSNGSNYVTNPRC